MADELMRLSVSSHHEGEYDESDDSLSAGENNVATPSESGSDKETPALVGLDRLKEEFYQNRGPKLRIRLRCCVCKHKIKDILVGKHVFCNSCRSAHHMRCHEQRHVRSDESDDQTDKSDEEQSEVLQPTSLSVHIWMKNLVHPKKSKRGNIKAHVKDVCTKWIGVPHDGKPRLLVWPRFEKCLAEAPSGSEQPRPSLISFFGDTNAGKSTIVKGLLKLQQAHREMESPVTGSDFHRLLSTSGDVHLYSDPATINTLSPMFYADSEGLNGTYQTFAATLPQWVQKLPGIGSQYLNAILAYDENAKCSWPLEWSTLKTPENADEWRKDVVANLFPRFLYMFSDVVCHVTINSRTTVNDLAQLVRWANLGFDTTINQRLRPSLLLIINKEDGQDSVLRSWCDVDFATEQILKALNGSPFFESEKQKWASRGRKVENSADLLNCYYDGVKVLVIPSIERMPTHVVLEQYRKLYSLLRDMSSQMQETRGALGVATTVEDFSFYVDDVLRHMAKDFKQPVNLHQIISDRYPLPSNFHEHVTAMLAEYLQTGDHVDPDETGVLKVFTKYIAGCIAIRARRSTDGWCQPHDFWKTRTDLDGETGAFDAILKECLQQCSFAFQAFHKRSWRCEHKMADEQLPHLESTHAPASNRELRCLNYLKGHEKGHQFRSSSNAGQLHLREGPFKSSFNLESHMKELQEHITRQSSYSRPAVSQKNLAHDCKIWRIKTKRTCLGCLARRPTKRLDCGHMLCEHCLALFGAQEPLEEHVTTLYGCPFQDSETTMKFACKPRSAGVRTLTLDGGGVRGLLELELLKSLEQHVGFEIPIQQLFDLVLGTSSGAIITLGIFAQGWTVTEATGKFKSLVNSAFQKRGLHKVFGLGWLAKLFYTHKYETSGIESALQIAFGTGVSTVLSNTESSPSNPVKVGAIATSSDGKRTACLLSNYVRDWSEDSIRGLPQLRSTNGANGLGDYLRKEASEKDELLAWEVARASSAAPTFFEEFTHSTTGRRYQDGAIFHNNPIAVAEWERRLIWTDFADKRPDIVISVGSGVQKDASVPKDEDASAASSIGAAKLVQTMLDMQAAATDCERQWREVCRYTIGTSDLLERYHRVNLQLANKPCDLDDVSAIQELSDTAADLLHRKSSVSYNQRYRNCFDQLRAIAEDLISKLFYFNTVHEDCAEASGELRKVSGQLRCRLDRRYKNQFRKLLRGDNRGGPIFQVRQHGQTGHPILVKEEAWDMEHFMTNVAFDVQRWNDPYYLEMKLEKGQKWWPISGFPRLVAVSLTPAIKTPLH